MTQGHHRQKKVNRLSDSGKKIILCLCLALITGTLFGITLTYDFVGYDDPEYITENRHVQAGLTIKGLAWTLKTRLGEHNHYHPVTLLSHMLDCQIFGLNPAGHHFTSVLIHVLNTILIFLVLERMTKALWPSLLVAALFALHPLHVESVAWISGRKDILSTFFMLTALWVYRSYAEKPGTGRYFLTFLLFVAGALSKSMLVTFPLVMLLLDYWPLGRLSTAVSEKSGEVSLSTLWKSRVLLEKVPFLLISAVVGAVAMSVRQSGSIFADLSTGIFSVAAAIGGVFAGSLAFADGGRIYALMPHQESLIENLIDAANGYALYIWKMFFPTDLSIGYLRMEHFPVWQSVVSFALLAFISYLCIRYIKRHPYLIVGWLWFIGMLLPVAGIVKGGPSLAADRYTYVSFIGLFIMLSWGLTNLIEKRPQSKRVVVVGAILFLTVCSVLSLKQIRHWRNSITLFSNAVAVNPNHAGLRVNLATAFLQAGNDREAIKQLTKADQIAPEHATTQYAVGSLLLKMGRYQDAIDHFSRSISADPKYLKPYLELAVAFQKTDHKREAIKYLEKAVQLSPGNATICYRLGSALFDAGRYRDAVEHFSKLLRMNPESAEIHLKLGICLGQEGKFTEAYDHFIKAAKFRPDDPNIYYNHGVALVLDKKEKEAVEQFKKALEVDPDFEWAQEAYQTYKNRR